MSVTQSITTGPTPRVLIRRVRGHLTLSGWDRPEVQVRARRDGDLSLQEAAGGVEINCSGHCLIAVPLQAAVQLQGADGHTSVSMILNTVAIGHVDGDLSLSSVNGATVEGVDGDLSVRLVAGPVTVGSVDGDVRIRQVAGDVHLDSIDGDLALSEVAGSVHATVDGDARLQLTPLPGQTFVVAADGDIVCEVPTDVSAVVRLRAEGDLRVRNLGEAPARGHDVTLQLGAGEARLDLNADGDLALKGVDRRVLDQGVGIVIDIDEETRRRTLEVTQQITAQIEGQVSSISRQLEEKIAQMGENPEMASRIQDSIQGAMRRAEEKIAEAMRKVEQRVQEAERRSGEADPRRRKASAPPPAPFGPPPPPKPRRPAPTDEERMLILRMVEQGKISVEQAEKLLAALNS